MDGEFGGTVQFAFRFRRVIVSWYLQRLARECDTILNCQIQLSRVLHIFRPRIGNSGVTSSR